jgi:hypothetical protein
MAARAAGLKGAALQSAEAEVAKAAAQALHLLASLKRLVPQLMAAAAAAMVDPLISLYQAGQPVLAQHAVEVLAEMCSHPDSTLAAPALAKTLGRLLKVHLCS